MRRLALAVLCLATPALADTALPAPAVGVSGAWKEGAEARALIAPWRRCEALARELPFDEEQDWERGRLTARRVGPAVEAQLASEGSGRDAYGSYTRLRLEPGRCDARTWMASGPKEWLDARVWLGWVGAAPAASLPEVAQSSGATLVDDPAHPAFAAARLAAQLWGRDDEGAGPWPVQPEHPGRPTGSPATLWTAAALRSIGANPSTLVAHDDEGTPDALLVWPVRAPRLVAKMGRFQLWELRFRARNGGGLLAVYDRVRDRHRWVWGTHGDWPDGQRELPLDQRSFRIVAAEDGARAVIINSFEHQTRRVVVELASGRVTEQPWQSEPR